MSELTDKVAKLIAPIISDFKDINLFDIDFNKEGSDWYLHVYVDKNGGISVDDCALISDQISTKLDGYPDLIETAYYLDVSSPGAERVLKTENSLNQSINKYVHVSLYQKINGKKEFEGYLTQVNKNDLVIEYLDKGRQKKLSFNRPDIAQIRLAIDFSKLG
ncbi:MAG: ribosome maturation factor RimP [Firmicutes bacterium]|uniref:Ribosome maturation factor RimP n=1 Tax=Candidatus Gallilactobacillus intestinavium TaxID=2840838 RepID=A0A9D9E886_9LACO|nr:ribosome maturation factor RimP [Candidatus Gallilactobacillus intestinavium]